MKATIEFRTEMMSAADGGSGSGSPSSSARKRGGNRRRGRGKSLIETAGPDPSTPIEDVRLTVGRLGAPHGVQGEIKLRLLTDEPEHLETIETVYLGDRDEPIGLEGIRFINDGAIVKLGDTDTPEDASKLSGLAVKIAGSDARPLEEGEYFLFQLIGLEAVNEAGDRIGTVTDLIETGAHDVLVIGKRPEGGADLLVPNHPEFVPEIDPAGGRVVVRPPEYAN